jgi:hypothetical protein
VVVANNGSNDVSVLLGLGNGSFLASVNQNVGRNPSSLALDDLDVDGAIDLVTANPGSNNLSVLRGAGNGRFASVVTYTAGARPIDVGLGDLDGDGRIDIVVTNNDGNLANPNSSNYSALIGVGDATFHPAVNYGMKIDPQSISLGDLDGDGAYDPVAASGSNDIWVFPGIGDGTFRLPARFSVGIFHIQVCLGDIDGEGALDVAVITDRDACMLLTSLVLR